MKPLLHPRRLWVLAAVLSSSFVAVPSLASETYPPTLKAMMKLKTVPQCTLCHASNLGGQGTVSTKFGKALVARGATGSSNFKALTKALNSEEDDPVDSDGDGVFDLDELLDGSDPNVKDREPPPDPDPDPQGEGGSVSSAGAPTSGGTGSQPQTQGGAPAAKGGSSSNNASGGSAATPDEPEAEEPTFPEYPTLQSGCSLGAATAPGGISGLVALSLVALLRRARRVRS